MNGLEMLEVFSGTLHAKMARARDRCWDVAGSEKLMGYTESAAMYEEMGEEISHLALWAHQEENRLAADPSYGSEDEVDPDCLSGVWLIRVCIQCFDEFLREAQPPGWRPCLSTQLSSDFS